MRLSFSCHSRLRWRPITTARDRAGAGGLERRGGALGAGPGRPGVVDQQHRARRRSGWVATNFSALNERGGTSTSDRQQQPFVAGAGRPDELADDPAERVALVAEQIPRGHRRDELEPVGPGRSRHDTARARREIATGSRRGSRRAGARHRRRGACSSRAHGGAARARRCRRSGRPRREPAGRGRRRSSARTRR